jgi:integrase
MPRPVLPIGTYGKLSVRWSDSDNAFKASARFRDADGVTRKVAKFAQKKGAAEQALREALRDRQRRSGAGMNSHTLITDLIDDWLTRVETSTDLSVGTKQLYRYFAERYVRPAIGQLTIGEARVSVVDRALRTINQRHGYSVAKTCRAVLSGCFGLAVRHDALPANPVRDVDKLTGSKKKRPKAFTADQTDELTDRLRTIPQAVTHDIPDVVDFMLATGCRIGEAMACREWPDDDGTPLLDLEVGTWNINATVVRITGTGLVIQLRPKSQAGNRTLALPPYAVDMLTRRRQETRLRPRRVKMLDAAGNVTTVTRGGLVFPAPSARTLRDPVNAEKVLRRVLDGIDCQACSGTGYRLDSSGAFLLNGNGRRVRCDAGPWSWVTSHTFRKTVATRMEEAGLTPRQVADQLGHSKVSMAQDVYFGRGVVVADAARVLER